jgi:hypothetical protein
MFLLQRRRIPGEIILIRIGNIETWLLESMQTWNKLHPYFSFSRWKFLLTKVANASPTVSKLALHELTYLAA